MALQVEKQYGEGTLAKYADSTSVAYESLKRYRTVAAAYPREKGTRVPDLTWSHHRAVAGHQDRDDWLKKAEVAAWSVRQLEQAVSAAGAAEWRRASEKEAAQQGEAWLALRDDIEEQRHQGASEEAITVYLESLQEQGDPAVRRVAQQALSQRTEHPVQSGPFINIDFAAWRRRAEVLAFLDFAGRLTDRSPAEAAEGLVGTLVELGDDGKDDALELGTDPGMWCRRIETIREWLAELVTEVKQAAGQNTVKTK